MSSFCAFGFRSDSSPALATWEANVIDAIKALNNKAVVNDLSVDMEVSPGLHSFCEHQQIDQLLYINTEKRRKIGPNSQEVFYELSIVEYADSGETQLVNLLVDAAIAYPGAELYLFFAFEWEANVFSRFITCQKAGLSATLRTYDMYFARLFDSHTGNYVIDFETPTVIRII